jgi:adenylate cyclase
LAAIVVADVVGYSRLMGRDESGTVARLRRTREQRLSPILSRRGGRIVKLMGDGVIIEFASAVEALSAAIEFQRAMADDNRNEPAETALLFRLGLHLGDLIVEGEDLYGEGVNVAARLEAEAPAGGIVVSGAARDFVGGRVKARFADMGELALKNIERPVRAWRVEWDEADWQIVGAASPARAPEAASTALALPEIPSIAVLPFQNMSGDPEQEYFADGMVEDIITALSRFKSLFVIARNSSFSYKGKSPDIRQVGRELGVLYVLEGSVRRAGGRVRITTQLIEAERGIHLWADHFDGTIEDVFELQDKVALGVAGAIEPTLLTAHIRRSLSRPTGDLTAYDLYLRAIPLWLTGSTEDLQRALALLREAIDRDRNFAMALAVAGEIQSMLADRLEPQQRDGEVQAALELLRRALATGTDDPAVLAEVGGVLAFRGELATARPLIAKAVAANPGSAFAWQWSGWVRICTGEPEQALQDFDKAWRLSPRDPFDAVLAVGRGIALFQSRRFGEALDQLVVAVEQDPQFAYGHAILAACHAHLGDPAAGARVLDRLRRLLPHYDLANVDYMRNPEHRQLVLEGLQLIERSMGTPTAGENSS